MSLHVKHVGEFLHFQSMEEIQLLKDYFFHLPGEHQIYFRDGDIIDQLIVKPSITKSIFTSWMECNKKFPEARQLTYIQFVSKFVYVTKDRCWKPRKKGNTIGRLL